MESCSSADAHEKQLRLRREIRHALKAFRSLGSDGGLENGTNNPPSRQSTMQNSSSDAHEKQLRQRREIRDALKVFRSIGSDGGLGNGRMLVLVDT